MTLMWRALWPQAPWADPVLAAIATYLDDGATQAELQRCDDAGEYPTRAITELDQRGLPALFADAAGEPSRITFFHLCALNALLGSCNGSLAITVGVNALGLLPIYLAASPTLRSDVFASVRAGAKVSMALTERPHGSDLLQNVASAERTDGARYRLRGAKHLINGGARHDIILALLRTRAATEGRTGIRALQDFTLFALPRDCGITAGERTRTLPAPAADISSVQLDGAEVREDRIVGREGDGFAVIQRTLTFSRGGVSCIASGAASRAVELAIAHAHERTLYGGPIILLAPIADHLLRASSCDAAAAALAIKQAAACNALGPAAAYLTSCAKLACCELAERAVRETSTVLAAQALVHDRPFHALLRDVWLYGVFDGTRHVMLEQIQAWLPQLVRRDEDDGAYDLAAATAMYRAATRSIIDAAQLPSRVALVPARAHLRALAALPGAVSLAPLVAIAQTLYQVVAAARRSSAWERDACLRFDAASAAAHLEAVIAMVELADPDRRRAVVGDSIGWTAEHTSRYAYAIAWHAVELGSIVQRLALRTGAPASSIADAIALAVEMLETVRPGAAASLRRGAHD